MYLVNSQVSSYKDSVKELGRVVNYGDIIIGIAIITQVAPASIVMTDRR